MSQEYTCDSCGHPLSKSGYYTAKKRGYCRQCKPQKAGKAKESPPPNLSFESGSSPSPEPATFQEPTEQSEPIENESPEWLNFEFDEEPSTEHIPTALKMAVSMKGGEATQINHETNLEILKLGLTGVDVVITKYGQAITLDEEYTCKHSESDKELVATAQYRWMLENGIDPSSIIGTGTLAGVLTGWYVVPPIMKVRKKAKVRLFKGFGFMSKIPLVGRLFRRKKKIPQGE